MTARPLQVGDVVADVAAGFTGGFCLAVGLERHSPALLVVAAVWLVLAVSDLVRIHRAGRKNSSGDIDWAAEFEAHGEDVVWIDDEPVRCGDGAHCIYTAPAVESRSSVSLLGGDGSGATSPRAGSAGKPSCSRSTASPQTTNKAQQ